jgi:AbiV family abortive infection protein
MKERVLNPYWGKLPPDKIAEGMNVARANAARLASDARMMFEARRYETAAALAILAIEECGGISLLREFALATDGRKVKEGWKRLRSHTAKNAVWIFPELVARGARRLNEFAAEFDPSSDHTDVLGTLKRVCFYSDYYGKMRWHQPAGTMTEDLAAHFAKTAELFAAGRDVTPREIELWIGVLTPGTQSSRPFVSLPLNWSLRMRLSRSHGRVPIVPK